MPLCELCQDKNSENWLLAKYKTLDRLNDAWWTSFWSHTYIDWDEIESPAPHGEDAVHGLNLDWKRFVTDQTVDFCRMESPASVRFNPDLPVRIIWELCRLRIIGSLPICLMSSRADSLSGMAQQPAGSSRLGADIAFVHDINRSLKGGRPFMLMESTPSMTNWQDVSKLKRPGMHELSSLQAVAHGSDTVQYFQWRKSRGSSEKFHGAVVDHEGSEHTRVFQEVKKLGEKLEKLEDVAGTTVEPEAAIIFDWENRWALEDAQGPRNIGMHYERTAKSFYEPFWREGVPVDVIHMEADFSRYKLWSPRCSTCCEEGTAERIEQFVQNGGTFVATYWSGIVDENELTFLGGFPGGLRKTLGIWSEEIDALHDGQKNTIVMDEENRLGLSGSYEASELCDLIHLEGAEALAAYEDDFYAGRPALTVNLFGDGKAYYIASRNEAAFQEAFISRLIEECGIAKVLDTELPKGVTAQLRTDGRHDYIFVMNFTAENRSVSLPEETNTDVLKGTRKKGALKLPPYGTSILRRSHKA